MPGAPESVGQLLHQPLPRGRGERTSAADRGTVGIEGVAAAARNEIRRITSRQNQMEDAADFLPGFARTSPKKKSSLEADPTLIQRSRSALCGQPDGSDFSDYSSMRARPCRTDHAGSRAWQRPVRRLAALHAELR